MKNNNDIVMGVENIKKFEYLIQISYILSQTALYTQDYDDISVQIVNR